MARRDWLVISVLCLLCVALNLPVFGNDFVHDDVAVLAGGLIDHPERIREVFGSHAMLAQGQSEPLELDTYRPISILTFFWDAWLSGQAPWSYHLTNLLLHLGCVVSLFVLARRHCPSADVRTLVAGCAFFALSPQLVEAHVWVNGRSDPLATLFGLLSLLVVPLDARARTPLRLLLAGLLFLAGLLSKEVLLCSLPLILLLPSPASRSVRERLVSTLPMLLASLVYAAMRLHALGGARVGRDAEHLRSALHNLPILLIDGLSELFWPRRLYLHNMREQYAELGQAAWFGCVLVCLVLAVGAVLLRRRLPLLSWSIGFYAACLAPAALISALLWPGFGRYLYLPCAGLALGLCELFALAEQRGTGLVRGLGALLVSGYLALFCARFSAYARDYHDESTLYGAAMAQAKTRAVGYAWLGATRVREGKVEEGLALFEKAMRLEPQEPSYALRAVFWNLRLRRFTEAERLARFAIEHGPSAQAGEFRALLIRALMERDGQAAVTELCTCLTRAPEQERCLEAPRWFLDPRASQASALRAALGAFEQSCPSGPARAALAQVLRGLAPSP